jgi:hypothetical protein
MLGALLTSVRMVVDSFRFNRFQQGYAPLFIHEVTWCILSEHGILTWQNIQLLPTMACHTVYNTRLNRKCDDVWRNMAFLGDILMGNGEEGSQLHLVKRQFTGVLINPASHFISYRTVVAELNVSNSVLKDSLRKQYIGARGAYSFVYSIAQS